MRLPLLVAALSFAACSQHRDESHLGFHVTMHSDIAVGTGSSIQLMANGRGYAPSGGRSLYVEPIEVTSNQPHVIRSNGSIDIEAPSSSPTRST